MYIILKSTELKNAVFHMLTKQGVPLTIKNTITEIINCKMGMGPSSGTDTGYPLV